MGATVAHTFPLQPYWQVVGVPATHVPELLQVSAVVKTPPVQPWAAPQPVPAVLLLVFTQVDVPVAQEVAPFSHGLPVLQARLGVQLLHEPSRQ